MDGALAFPRCRGLSDKVRTEEIWRPQIYSEHLPPPYIISRSTFCLYLLGSRFVMGMCQEPILGSVSPSRQSVHETQTPHGVESNDPNTAYRVQGIPQRFDQAELEVAIRELLHVEEHERVIIRCFTTNLSQGYRGTRSAVFNLACVYLPQEISGAGQRWVFPSFRGSVTGEVLVIDSSFKGLTVLYEPEPTMHQFE